MSEPGYECEFAEELPRFVRASCPICLLVLRDPHQVTCCGKSFCCSCISRVQDTSTHCPACMQEDFDLYPDKGLRQELCGYRVYCSNRNAGCNWMGELGEISGHLNAEPDIDERLDGCAYAEVACLYCSEVRLRCEIKEHEESNCFWRPFTCEMCGEYESAYEDVVTNHAPVCKCRPVVCPNSCGADNLQHRHLEEHVCSHCPLSYVECEFSDAGCDAKLQRKDLPSHLTDNIVTHMSLLAAENRKLKQQLQDRVERLASTAKMKRAKERKRIRSLQAFVEKLTSEMKQSSRPKLKNTRQKARKKKRTSKVRASST